MIIEIDIDKIGAELICQIQDYLHDAMMEADCLDKYQQVINNLKDETHTDNEAWSTFRVIAEFLKSKELHNEINKE